jgi:hypothetical protein
MTIREFLRQARKEYLGSAPTSSEYLIDRLLADLGSSLAACMPSWKDSELTAETSRATYEQAVRILTHIAATERYNDETWEEVLWEEVTFISGRFREMLNSICPQDYAPCAIVPELVDENA